MTDQLKPPHAASLWYTPLGWRCELPHPSGATHTILVKEENIGSLLAMLRVRTGESKLGEPGDKTQYQIGQASLDAAKAKFAKSKKAKPVFSETTQMNVRDIIRRLGLA